MSRRDFHTALAAYGVVIGGLVGQMAAAGSLWPLAGAAVALMVLFIVRAP